MKNTDSYTYDGATRTLIEWAKFCNISVNSVKHRIEKGIPMIGHSLKNCNKAKKYKFFTIKGERIAYPDLIKKLNTSLSTWRRAMMINGQDAEKAADYITERKSEIIKNRVKTERSFDAKKKTAIPDPDIPGMISKTNLAIRMNCTAKQIETARAALRIVCKQIQKGNVRIGYMTLQEAELCEKFHFAKTEEKRIIKKMALNIEDKSGEHPLVQDARFLKESFFPASEEITPSCFADLND